MSLGVVAYSLSLERDLTLGKSKVRISQAPIPHHFQDDKH